MVMQVKRVYVVSSLINFLETIGQDEPFKKAVDSWKKELEQDTGYSYKEICEKDIYSFVDSDDLELEKILEKTPGQWMLFYNQETDEFHIFELALKS